MTAMRFMNEDQLREVIAEAFAREIADRAQALQVAASQMNFVLEITSIADAFGIVTVRRRDTHAAANRVSVPA